MPSTTGAKKISAYQKLKRRNAELTKDIIVLVNGRPLVELLEVRFKWNAQLEGENIMLAGSTNT